MEIAKVKHCYTYCGGGETVNVTSWTMFLEGLLLHSSEFLLHFANVICFNFQRVVFRVWIYGTSTEQRMDIRCSRDSLPVHWNGMLRKSRSHLAVQNQPSLNWISCWLAWAKWKLEPGEYADDDL